MDQPWEYKAQTQAGESLSVLWVKHELNPDESYELGSYFRERYGDTGWLVVGRPIPADEYAATTAVFDSLVAAIEADRT